MPEAPAWKFQKLLQNLAPIDPIKAIVTGRVLTGVDDEIIEDGYVKMEDGVLTEVGRNSDRSGGRWRVRFYRFGHL